MFVTYVGSLAQLLAQEIFYALSTFVCTINEIKNQIIFNQSSSGTLYDKLALHEATAEYSEIIDNWKHK